MLPSVRQYEHLHTEECNELVKRYHDCTEFRPWLERLGNVCTPLYDGAWACLKAERIYYRDNNKSKPYAKPHPRNLKHLPEAYWPPQDFSKFSASDFDAKEWINDSFQTIEPDKDREQYAQALVMKLQLFIQEMNKSLEETSQQITQTMPRTIREVDAMQQEAVLLQNRMKSVEQEVQKVEQDTVSAMDSLLKIDTVKGRVHEVEKALREIDNWTVLKHDMDEIFASGNPEIMAERLASMQKCLRVLGTKVPDYKERRDFVDQLKDQFVAATSPSVVAAFTSQSVESVQYFGKLFADIDRTSDLEQYYQKCLKTDLKRKWDDIISDENADAKQVLSSFHDCLLSTWFSQLKWSTPAMSNAATVLCSGLASSLPQLEPSMESVLGNKLDSVKDKLATLTILKQSCDSFAKSLHSSFASIDALAESQEADRLLDAIYEPLINFGLNYQQYQTSALLEKINIWTFDSQNFGENVRKLEKSFPTVFSDAREAIERCNLFVGDVGLPLLLKSLQAYLSNFMAKLKKYHTCVTVLPGGEKNTFSDENWDLVDFGLKTVHIAGKMQIELSVLEENLYPAFSKLKAEKSPENSIDRNRRKSVSSWSRFEDILSEQARLKLALEGLMLRHSSNDSEDHKFLPDIQKQIQKFTNRSIRISSEMILGPLSSLLESLPRMTVWAAANVGESLSQSLPTFSLAPQEYITKIGQYLVTFAHHLEPYLSGDDSGMTIALMRGTLPYMEERTTRASESGQQAVQWWLQSAGLGLMTRYVEICLRIKELTPSGAKQLATDIEYLCNVVEDLGLSPSQDLSGLRALLLMDKNEIKTVTEYPSPLIAAVREMRKLK